MTNQNIQKKFRKYDKTTAISFFFPLLEEHIERLKTLLTETNVLHFMSRLDLVAEQISSFIKHELSNFAKFDEDMQIVMKSLNYKNNFLLGFSGFKNEPYDIYYFHTSTTDPLHKLEVPALSSYICPFFQYYFSKCDLHDKQQSLLTDNLIRQSIKNYVLMNLSTRHGHDENFDAMLQYEKFVEAMNHVRFLELRFFIPNETT